MPNRIISSNICKSESLAELTWFEQMLFIRLIVSADDYGRFDARPQILKGSLFPFDDITVASIQKAITRLSTNGMISLYEVAGKPYLELCAWRKYNTPRAKESKYPEKTGCSDLQADANGCKQTQADSPDIRYSEFDIRNSIFENRGAPAPASPKIDFERIVSMYHSALPNSPKCTKLSDARKKAIKARFSSGYTEEDFQMLFQKAAESDFLLGKNQRNWSVTFDWLIQDGNMAKVLSGNYDPPSGGKASGQVRRLDEDEIATIRRMMEE